MKESDIRPAAIFDEFLALAQRDIVKYFQGEGDTINCPACGAEGGPAFVKHGFHYRDCGDCKTLFVSPRPKMQAFSKYYEESESARYWASTFYRETAEARREKLWKPKARLLAELVREYGTENYRLFDIGGGYGIFAEEYKKASGKDVVVIEPGPALAEVCRSKGLDVVQAFLEQVQPEQLGDGPKAFVSFELFEHLHDPRVFLDQLHRLMKKDDLFIFTTLSGTGADIQALWEDSKSVSPPHHLNFFNPVSVRRLLERTGLRVLNVQTPGKLDVDILCNNQDKIKDRFWRTFVAQANEEQKQFMQDFLAANRMSSHMLIICQKP